MFLEGYASALVKICFSALLGLCTFYSTAATGKIREIKGGVGYETTNDSVLVTYPIVMATFLVDKKGRLEDIRIVNNDCASCTDEQRKTMEDAVVKIISDYPNWTPGKQNGRPVKVRYNLPVKFEMQGDKLCLPKELPKLTDS